MRLSSGRSCARLFLWMKDRGHYRRCHRRTRRPDHHQVRARRVRGGLRHHPRPPGHQPDRDPAPADRQVPGQRPRHGRIPVPDQQRWHLGPPHHVDVPDAHCIERADRHRHSPARHDARGKGVLPRVVDPRLGQAGTGKTSIAATFVNAACKAGREVPPLHLRGVREPVHPEHEVDRDGLRTAGSKKVS